MKLFYSEKSQARSTSQLCLHGEILLIVNL